jgi:alkaline phosphatase
VSKKLRSVACSLGLAAAAALILPVAPSAASRAKNVVLFLADAGGIATVNAASWHAHQAPQKLFLQRMPHIGLSDTSPFGGYVTDSAAGMTAITSGHKTKNGVIAQSPTAERKVKDGEALKSILEYAEERGLSTGIITNDAITGATPAVLYAKANDRGMTSFIFQQIFTPRFGDGPDVMISGGRGSITKALAADDLDLDALGQTKGRPILKSLDALAPDTKRAIVVMENGRYDVEQAVQSAIAILSRNPKGYFLMVEWDTHTNNVAPGVQHMVEMDRAVERTARIAGSNTLLLFTADHSFDLRITGGSQSKPVLTGVGEAQAKADAADIEAVETDIIRMADSHTGEEVLIAAMGPGSERVHGYMPNTAIFDVMMSAFGWKK